MIVKLFDETEIVISKDQAERLKQALAAGVNHVEIKDHWIKTSAIATIKPGGERTEVKALPARSSMEHRGTTSSVKNVIKKLKAEGKSFSEIAQAIKQC